MSVLTPPLGHGGRLRRIGGLHVSLGHGGGGVGAHWGPPVLSSLTSQRIQRSEFFLVKPVRTPVAIFGSLGVCIYGPASRHWLISYSFIHLT